MRAARACALVPLKIKSSHLTQNVLSFLQVFLLGTKTNYFSLSLAAHPVPLAAGIGFMAAGVMECKCGQVQLLFIPAMRPLSRLDWPFPSKSPLRWFLSSWPFLQPDSISRSPPELRQPKRKRVWDYPLARQDCEIAQVLVLRLKPLGSLPLLLKSERKRRALLSDVSRGWVVKKKVAFDRKDRARKWEKEKIRGKTAERGIKGGKIQVKRVRDSFLSALSYTDVCQPRIHLTLCSAQELFRRLFTALL